MRQPSGKTAAPGERVAMWDGAVRLVHLGFILLIPTLWWSWKSGDMDLHKRLGIVMLGLVLFRILWGLMGSSTARFARFVRGPAAILAYLRGRAGGDGKEPVEIGHNPLGGWSVIAMLSLLALQLGLGLIAQDVDGSNPVRSIIWSPTRRQRPRGMPMASSSTSYWRSSRCISALCFFMRW